MRVAGRNETDDDEIAIEQGKKLVATYADKLAEDIDSLWFLLVFPDCLPNAQGIFPEKVSVIKRLHFYLIQIDGSLFQSNALFVPHVTRLCVMELIWQGIFNSKLHQNYLNKQTKQLISTLNAQQRFLLSEETQAWMIQQKLKLYASKLLQFLHVQSVHLTTPLIVEDKCL